MHQTNALHIASPRASKRMKNEVIDLVDDAVVVGGGSPLSSISSSMQQHQQLQYRKGRAGRNALGIPSDNNIPAIDLETSPPAAPHRPKKKMTADSRSSGSNVIDLEAAPNFSLLSKIKNKLYPINSL